MDPRAGPGATPKTGPDAGPDDGQRDRPSDQQTDHPGGREHEVADFRLLPAAVAVWVAAAVAQRWSVTADLAGAGLLLLAGLVVMRARRVCGLPLLLAAAAVAVTALRLAGGQAGPVPALAQQRAAVTATAVVTSDPQLRPGPFGDFVLLRLLLTQVTGAGRSYAVRTPVLAFGDPVWRRVAAGQRVRVSGRLDTADGADLAAVLVARGPPTDVAPPGPVGSAVNDLRRGLRASVAGLPPAERALVPALVDGDDAGMPEDVADDFRVTGLTHLLAVSGANLTLVLAFLLVVGRWCGVRARGLLVLGGLGVVGFVLLARTEPSVLRAAAMGVVALAGLGSGGRRRGIRALCVAVVVLVLFDPWLARSVGFALSVVATSGILLLAPGWRDALGTWMPRWLAEALAVPMAAQLVCTPVIAAISGQVSLVAVVANLLAAPAVAPATVLGVVATVVAPLSSALAGAAGWLAGRAAWWIVTVAEHGAALPGAAVPWAASAGSLALLGAVCLVVMLLVSRLLGRPASAAAVALLGVLVVLRPVGALGWPPPGWVMVACDVGQGDGLVLNAGAGSAVVVDAGPEPELIDRCLDRLDVRRVALLLITHLHADHAEGVEGVGSGREVGEVEIGPLDTPEAEFRLVLAWAAREGVPVRRAVYGEARRLGPLSWQVIAPDTSLPLPHTADGDESGDENNASLVLRLRSRGLTLLLTGDVEPEAQQALLRSGAELHADVLKVPHHGSRYQEPDFLSAVGADVAVVSVGADNDYGHPAEETLSLLRRSGTRTHRTDVEGDVAVVVRGGRLLVETRH